MPKCSQLWRLDEAESMLRSAIKLAPGYFSAMSSLGAILHGKKQVMKLRLTAVFG